MSSQRLRGGAPDERTGDGQPPDTHTRGTTASALPAPPEPREARKFSGSADLGLAWRLVRGAPGRAWLLILCIAIGVAARAFVGTLGASAEAALAREARPLLGGDLEIASQQPLDSARQATLDASLPANAQRTTVRSFVSMVRAHEQVRLTDVRAVDSGWPLLGSVSFGQSLPGVSDLASALAQRDGMAGAIAEPALLQSLNISVGDSVQLGRTSVVITAELLAEPGRSASLFSIGPRLVVGEAVLAATGLTGPGARVRYGTLVLLPDPQSADAVARRLAETWKLPDTNQGFGGTGAGGVQVRSAPQAQFGLNRAFDRLGDFLRLLALAALLLGGVGVASLVGGAVRARLDEMAILQVLGAAPIRTARLLLMQIAGLALVGSLLGAVIGSAGAWLLLTALAGHLPIPVTPVLTASAVGMGIGCGLLVALAFSAAPILALRSLLPAAVLRGESPPLRGGAAAWGVIALAAAAIAALAVYEARSPMIGLGFIAALAIGAALLGSVGWLALRGLSRLRPRGIGVRLGLANLARPGLRPVPAVIAIGLSALLFAALATWQRSLEQEFDPALRGDLPSLFAVDVQDDQTATFIDIVKRCTGREPLGMSPVVTARYRGKPGEETPTGRPLTREEERARFFRDREQRLSWRAAPGPDERTISGRWPVDDPTDPDRVEASLESGFARQLGVQVGDQLLFDVQGTSLTANVVGIRDVRFAGLKPNFFILLNPAALAGAPTTWIAAVADLPAEQRAAVTRDVVSALPNVNVLDISAIAAQVRDVVGKLVAALRLVAWFALAAGLVVLAGVCLAGARERRADGALLRTLGAGDRTLIAALLSEFAGLGLVAATLGTAIGAGTAAILLTFGMRLAVHPPWLLLGSLALGIIALAAATGWLANRSVLRTTPLDVLREG